jgi:ammonia channel protein AmtB
VTIHGHYFKKNSNSYAGLNHPKALILMEKFMPVRTTHDEEKRGLDISHHGEEAYLEA